MKDFSKSIQIANLNCEKRKFKFGFDPYNKHKNHLRSFHKRRRFSRSMVGKGWKGVVEKKVEFLRNIVFLREDSIFFVDVNWSDSPNKLKPSEFRPKVNLEKFQKV